MKNSRISSLIVALLFTTILVGACGSMNIDGEKQTVTAYHQHFNSSKYQTPPSFLSSKFLESVGGAEGWNDYATKLRSKIGKQVFSIPGEWRVSNGTSGRQASLAYESEYEKATVSEAFVIGVEDGKFVINLHRLRSEVFLQ